MPQLFSQLALLIFSPILWHDVHAPRARARSPPDEILLHPNLDTKKEKAFEKRVHLPRNALRGALALLRWDGFRTSELHSRLQLSEVRLVCHLH